MQFNLGEVPFSHFGSYLAIDRLPAADGHAAGVCLRTLHDDAPRREICRIELSCHGESLSWICYAMPGLLRIAPDGSSGQENGIDICFADAATLRLRGRGVGLRLRFSFALYDNAIAWRDGWLVNLFSNRMRYALFVEGGACACDALNGDWVFECEPDGAGIWEIAIAEALQHWPQRCDIFSREFALCAAASAREFKRWLQATPAVSDEFKAARELAAYVQWSSVVAPHGNFQRAAMLMSKHWFNGVWSWDHCFNAMALFAHHPALAWDQFALLFDHQDDAGALPDCVSDATVVWNFRKPPIHGWTLQWLLHSGDISFAQLEEVYAPLARWTQWWFDQRATEDGIPSYLHGNDSGWDNASVFDGGCPVQSPDLATFLVLQMDALAVVARRLKMTDAAADWQRRADALLEKLLTRFWLGKRFVALHGKQPCTGDSLLLLMPIVLGERLPKSIQRELVDALKQENRFLTEFGLASESVSSSFYESDGYWRGPIWAPAVFMIVESLRVIGEKVFADEIARRFCRTVARSGIAENFDALSGAGLCDRAHTWTASVFLLLAHSLNLADG